MDLCCNLVLIRFKCIVKQMHRSCLRYQLIQLVSFCSGSFRLFFPHKRRNHCETVRLENFGQCQIQSDPGDPGLVRHLIFGNFTDRCSCTTYPVQNFCLMSLWSVNNTEKRIQDFPEGCQPKRWGHQPLVKFS